MQRRFKPPLLAANGNQSVMSLSEVRVRGKELLLVSTTVPLLVVLRGMFLPCYEERPTIVLLFQRELQRCGYGSFPSSTGDSKVCFTPGVYHGRGVLMEVQVRHASDDSRIDSLGIISMSKGIIQP